jgi:Tol biopolymer transport system component
MNRRFRLALERLVTLAAFSIAATAWSGSSEAALPTPMIFAPGVVSGPQNDGAPTFTSDAKTIYFERSYGHRSIIFESRRVGASWSKPRVASFSGPWSDQQPSLSPDGSRLVFASARREVSTEHPNDPPKTLAGVWCVDRTKSGWSKPIRLPETVNISNLVFKPSIARNGDLYFMSAASSGADGPNWRLFQSAWINGAYQPAQPLSFSVGPYFDVDPYIAPDQSYILFSSRGRRSPDDGHEHLYVALRVGKDWGAVHALRYVGDDWGADDGEAQVSPDGMTLYFSSSRQPPVDRTKPRDQMLADIARSEAWDNGNTNVWSLPILTLFEANGLSSTAQSELLRRALALALARRPPMVIREFMQ